jgi:hypothetical protein
MPGETLFGTAMLNCAFGSVAAQVTVVVAGRVAAPWR